MQYEIISYVGIGPIKLGMTQEEVRKAIGTEVRSVRRWGENFPSDSFDSPGITVGYHEPGICEFVELSGPVSPTFHGTTFLGRPYHEVRQWFESLDPTVKLSAVGLRSYRFGITIYARAAVKEPNEPVEAVSIFDEGYYARYGIRE